MPANALCLTATETDQPRQQAPGGERPRLGRPTNGFGRWHSHFAAAGFDVDQGVSDNEGEIPVHRCIDAVDGELLPDAHRAPTSVFELALKPVDMQPFQVPESAASPVLTARRLERTVGVTRCINVPVAESAEWQEREQARRARQRPPRPSRQKFKMKGSREWQDSPPAAVPGELHG